MGADEDTSVLSARVDAQTNNKTGRAIDFEQEIQAIKDRTEVDVPYVATHCADAMYLDQHTIVTLEYHCY